MQVNTDGSTVSASAEVAAARADNDDELRGKVLRVGALPPLPKVSSRPPDW